MSELSAARLAELHRRRAAALREQAAVDEAIAAELDGDAHVDAVQPQASAPAKKVSRRGPRIPRGIVVSETDRAHARALASDAGILRPDLE